MEMELSEKQLAKFNKKDIIQLLLQSMENEKQLRAEVTELTRELKKTNQQMQLLLEKWNLAQADRFGRFSEKNFSVMMHMNSLNSQSCMQNALMKQKQPVPDSLPLSRIWIRLRSEPINVKSKRENAKTT